jgi:hypothetical protein
MYVGNGILLGALAIDKYTRKNELCDYKCEMKCDDLVTLGKNTEIFFIADIVIVGITILIILVKNIYCCK